MPFTPFRHERRLLRYARRHTDAISPHFAADAVIPGADIDV